MKGWPTMTAATEQYYLQLTKFECEGCDNILHILGGSMSFFLLVLWEDGRASLKKAYGSKVNLRRSKGHLSNEILGETKVVTAGTGISVSVHQSQRRYKHLY